ncbi:eukaryotic translation initiation factor 3 subunit A [Rhodotorula kratochvilovae]
MAALSAVSEVFSSKRFRSTPLSVLEPIMVKFLELSVDLRKGRTAKDGLILYKNVAQNTSVQSVEVTIQKLLELSRAKLDDALAQVHAVEGAPASGDVDDLEAAETPESLLMSAISEEKTRDRNYRTLVTPWLRFLWESYRTALDILRNNARLEVLYQTVCHEAFQFCLTHQRKTEFRRLCETLRSHLASSQKYTHQSHSINLNEPDTLQRHLDTRFQQLNTAVELELWQEAFRTAEDIHTLVGMSKRAPKASVMASFYDKMAKVFAVGQNFLFHAAAYGKLYSLHAARVAMTGGADGTDAELDKHAARVLLAALAVPLGSGVESAKRVDGTEEGEGKGRLNRLASLIGLGAAPTRAGLLKDALARHVLKRVSSELRALYQILEEDFHPLSITRKIEPILAQLSANPDTARYVAPLKDVVLARLFQQLAQVYASLKIDRVVRLARFDADDALQTRLRIERYVTEACRRGDVDVTLDHASGSIKFVEDLFGDESAAPAGAADSLKALQPSSSALLRTQLTRLASTLHSTLVAVGSPAATTEGPGAARAAAFENLASAVADERETVLARTQIIQRRKELADEQSARKEKEEAHARSVRAQQLAEEEARRQKEELKRRELERIRKEVEKVKADEAKKVADSLIQGGLKVDMQKLPELSANDLVQLQVQQIEKDKKTLAQKLATAYKRLDHLERAFRKEEIPLIAQDYERQQTRDREAFVAAQKQRAEQAQREHAQGLAIKQSLQRILPDYEAFRARAEKESRAAFEREQQRLRDQLEEAKAERRRQHLEKLEQERQAAIQREKDEAERAAREEEEARIRAEEEEREAEERARIEERRRAADEAAKAEREARLAERRAEQEAIMAKARAQAQREEEALARRAGGGAAAPVRAAGGPAPIGSAEWRRQRDEAAAAARPAETRAPFGERPRMNLQPRSGDASPSGERPRLALAPRSTPRPESPAATPSPPPPAAAAAAPERPASGGRWLPPSQRGSAAATPAASSDDGSRPSTPGAGGSKYVPPSQRQAGTRPPPGGSRW